MQEGRCSGGVQETRDRKGVGGVWDARPTFSHFFVLLTKSSASNVPPGVNTMGGVHGAESGKHISTTTLISSMS